MFDTPERNTRPNEHTHLTHNHPAPPAALLLEHGASRHARNADGYLPRDIATIWKKFDVAVILKEVPPQVPGFRVTTVSPKSVGLEWDEPQVDEANQAPVTYYELCHRMKSSQQTHIDNDKLTLEWTRLPLIDYEETVRKKSAGRKFVFPDLLAASGHEVRGTIGADEGLRFAE